jgi:hypothetical protein
MLRTGYLAGRKSGNSYGFRFAITPISDPISVG